MATIDITESENIMAKKKDLKKELKSLSKGFSVRTYNRPDGSSYEKLQYSFYHNDKRYYTYGDTTQECLDKAEKKRKELEKEYVPNEKITIGQYFDELLNKSLIKNRIRQSTAHNKKVMFDSRIRPILGDKRIVDIQKRELEQFQFSLSERLSSSGTNMTMNLLKELFDKAIIDGIIEKNPTKGIQSFMRSEDEPTARETTHRALTDEEITIFLEAAQGSHYYNLFKFLLYSGARIGEAGAIRICDLDFKNSLISINGTLSRVSNTETVIAKPKTQAGKRQISLTDDLKKIIDDQIKQNEILFGRTSSLGIDGMLFRSTHGETVIEQRVNTCMQQIFKKLNRKKHIIDRFTPHAFRATYITRAKQAGVDPVTLMTIVGHSDIRMTFGLYYHETTEHIKEQSKLVRFA